MCSASRLLSTFRPSTSWTDKSPMHSKIRDSFRQGPACMGSCERSRLRPCSCNPGCRSLTNQHPPDRALHDQCNLGSVHSAQFCITYTVLDCLTSRLANSNLWKPKQHVMQSFDDRLSSGAFRSLSLSVCVCVCLCWGMGREGGTD